MLRMIAATWVALTLGPQQPVGGGFVAERAQAHALQTIVDPEVDPMLVGCSDGPGVDVAVVQHDHVTHLAQDVHAFLDPSIPPSVDLELAADLLVAGHTARLDGQGLERPQGRCCLSLAECSGAHSAKTVSHLLGRHRLRHSRERVRVL